MQEAYRNRDDETLVLLTLAGEQQAYEMLVIRYEKAVLAAARSVIGNGKLARDAAQDAFIAGWMKLPCLREPGKYGPWVCRIAKNCARNMVSRFRDFLSLDEIAEGWGNLPPEEEDALLSGPGTEIFPGRSDGDPAGSVIRREEKAKLHETVDGLSGRVKEIIRLYYFEELSVTEIAERLSLSEGTVKWQLHDGRKKLRKELSAMEERENDTLPMRVMKKVEELKLWQRKNRKSGFSAFYREVLSDLEALPETRAQQSATADVLMRGWWWLPEKEKDSEALLARIREAAVKGGNEEVIFFLAAKEDEKFYGDTRIAFLRDKQIPKLLAEGWKIAAGKETFHLATGYFWGKNPGSEGDAKGYEAIEQARELLPPSHPFHALAGALGETRKSALSAAELNSRRYNYFVQMKELRLTGNRVCGCDGQDTWVAGRLYGSDVYAGLVFANALSCDGEFLPPESSDVGSVYRGSDGSTLTVEGKETVTTPAGVFEGCLVVTAKEAPDQFSFGSYRSFFAPGVGIVRQEHSMDGFTSVTELVSYALTGKGSLPGPIPLSAGNRFEYRRAGEKEEMLTEKTVCEVAFADDNRAVLISKQETIRRKYDDSVFLDLMEQIRGDYWERDEKTGKQTLVDLSPLLARAEAAAKTPMEKAHAKAACSVARRIYETNPERENPTCGEAWNFFNRSTLRRDGEVVRLGRNFRWNFEWKCLDHSAFALGILNVDLFGILQDALGRVWDDNFRPGCTETVERYVHGYPVTTQLSVEEGGEVDTPAGHFEGCLALTVDMQGLPEGLEYRCGKRRYFFAPGVGLVKMEVPGMNGSAILGEPQTAYLLTAYKGEGEKNDYFPLAPGMMRRFEAPMLSGGYVGAAEYLLERDPTGDFVLFEDRAGYRPTKTEALFYGEVHLETLEETLWKEKRYDDSRLRHDLSNFYIALHYMIRDNHFAGVQKKAVAFRRSVMKMIEALFMEDGEIAPAILGLYGKWHFWLCVPLFGCLMKDQNAGDQADAIREEAYALLEKSIALLEKWYAIPDGTELEVGNPLLFGGIKLVKGKDVLLLPDGRREPLPNLAISFGLNPYRGDMLYGMTAPKGWEWFNPVRDEDRFKALIEVVREKNL